MPPYTPKKGDPISSLDTPSMLVHLPTMESNIAALFALLTPTGILIRPHLKTTKSPILAARLIAEGATGGCVAKLAEAEVMVDNGIMDLLITTEIIGPPKVARLVELVKRAPGLRIVVDSKEGADAIDKALRDASVKGTLDTLVDIDVGTHRTGVQPGAPALALARHVAGLDGLAFIGVQGYEGHAQHIHGASARRAACEASMKLLTSTADVIRGDGLDVRVVTCGGTGTAEWCAATAGVTEVQPGSFIFMDTDYHAAVGTERFSASLTVLSTVVSKPSATRAVIDAGLKSLTTDSGFAAPLDLEGVRYEPLGDEHGGLTWEEGGKGVELGDRVHMVPSHIDPTINLHDVYYAHRDGIIEEIWPVAGRGKVQ